MASKWIFNDRRSSIQIIAEILRLSRFKPVKKSSIKKQVKVSHQQINNYLDWLIRRQLIQSTTDLNGQIHFIATDKGFHLLSIIDKIRTILN